MSSEMNRDAPRLEVCVFGRTTSQSLASHRCSLTYVVSSSGAASGCPVLVVVKTFITCPTRPMQEFHPDADQRDGSC